VYLMVSIHAPARGATKINISIVLLTVCFNPRTREGCDHPYIDLHSPQQRFNPRTREGCDRCITPKRSWRHCGFQSTHPRGVRLLDSATLDRFVVIVSIHAPARGATRNLGGFVMVVLEFQSTHPRGVRLLAQLLICSSVRRVSIHAPARGATPRTYRGKLRLIVSIHAPV